MINLFIFMSLIGLFHSDMTITNLDDSVHHVSVLSDYEIVILYDNPYCHQCMENLAAIIKKYNVEKVAFIVNGVDADGNKVGFMRRKSDQQDIKEKFKLLMKDIYFDDSNNGFFAIDSSDITKYAKPLIPEFFIINNDKTMDYFPYFQMFSKENNPNYIGLKPIFEKYFKR